jgi:hypothetical protein
MDKLAKTKNPKRLALRVKKKQWNEETKKFIGDVIALKKGINGTGDTKHGIPPMDIDQIPPSQIGTFISELANSASKLIEEAKNITKEQESYALSIDKKASSNTELEIIKMAELISYASWWGSRFLSRFKLKGPQKKYIVNMMYSLVDILDKLKEFESQLLTLGRGKIPNSFTTLNTIVKKYLAAYVESAKKLSDFLPEELKISEENSRKFQQELSDLRKQNKKLYQELESLRKKNESPQAPNPKDEDGDEGEEGKPIEDGDLGGEDDAEEGKGRKNLSELVKEVLNDRQINKILGDFISAKITVAGILNSPNLYSGDGVYLSQLDTYIKSYEQYHKKFLAPMTKRMTANEIALENDRFKELYKEIRKIVNFIKVNKPYIEGQGFGELGTGKTPIGSFKDIPNDSSFAELIQKLIEIFPDEKAGFLSVLSHFSDYSLIKEASFQNWLRSQYIGANLDPIKVPDSFDIVQLDTYEMSKELRKEISSLLNALEDPNSSPVNILTLSENLNKLLIKLMNNMFKLGDIYSSFLRREDRVKNQHKIDVKYSDLSELRGLKNTLESLKFVNPNPNPITTAEENAPE